MSLNLVSENDDRPVDFQTTRRILPDIFSFFFGFFFNSTITFLCLLFGFFWGGGKLGFVGWGVVNNVFIEVGVKLWFFG